MNAAPIGVNPEENIMDNYTVEQLDVAIKVIARVRTCLEVGEKPTVEELGGIKRALEKMGFVPVPEPVITVL